MRLPGLLAAALFAAAGATASPAGAVAERGEGRIVCAGVSAIDVYFWPEGHGEVRELGFPAYPLPHVEFYRAAAFANTDFLAFAGARTSEETLARTCGPAADAAMAWAGGPSQQTAATQKVRCTFTGDVDIRVGPLNQTKRVKKFVRRKGKRVPVFVNVTTRIGTLARAGFAGSNGAVVSLDLKATGSTVRFDTRFCAAVPLLP